MVKRGATYFIDFARRDAEAASIGARPIPIAIGYYASIDGDIYSGRRLGLNDPLRKLKPNRNTFGYLAYNLVIDGKIRTYRGHRLVAMCFLPPCPSPLHGIRHKDDNPSNNSAGNLEWGTQAENIRDRDERGRTATGAKAARDIPKGELNPWSKLTDSQVAEIKSRLAKGEQGKNLAVVYGVSKSTISAVKTGKVWGHIQP